ncbi:unnamed protein product [Ceratitis capitata]|uniref:(Mediterranean fruit fly) hypothetical protein n=1 Tax=Ceratitis capitata TaxID=7213 RepID=A0A811UI63_CERCA|nr:unnamed protein product [Ceratitis capitata]
MFNLSHSISECMCATFVCTYVCICHALSQPPLRARGGALLSRAACPTDTKQAHAASVVYIYANASASASRFDNIDGVCTCRRRNMRLVICLFSDQMAASVMAVMTALTY